MITQTAEEQMRTCAVCSRLLDEVIAATVERIREQVHDSYGEGTLSDELDAILDQEAQR